MSYILSNGVKYISRDQNGKIITTQELGEATVFDTEKKAWNVLSCLPKDIKKKGYTPNPAISKAREPKVAASPAVKLDEGIHFPTKNADWLEEFKRNLVIVDETLGNLRNLYATVYSDLTSTSDEIEDLEHAMELTKPNAAKAFYFEDEMRKARQKRRACKDAMMLIELVMKFDLDDWGTGQVTAALDRLESRKYFPKVRKDLFE